VNTPEPPFATPGALPVPATVVPDVQLVNYTHVIYALHALSILIGVTTAVFVVTAFVASLPSIIAVIMNYVRRSDTRGTFLESHFRWQIRTFWCALLAFVVMSVLAIPLVLTIILIPLAYAGFAAIGIWVIYRIARGWLALRDGRPMYV
jgi:uncharacterized membrane protein